MGDYYQHFLTSMSGQGLQHNDHGGFPTIPPQPYQGQPAAVEAPSSSAPHTTMAYFPGSSDPVMYDGSKPKGRKKSTSAASGTEPIKHRRTRSGCFTCRSRRVKCDEQRPVCERCSKGHRECIYPDPPTSKAQRSRDLSTTSQQVSPLSSTGDGDDDKDFKARLETIQDAEESEYDSNLGQRPFFSPQSATTSPSQPAKHALSEASTPDDKSSSPSTVTSSSLVAASNQPSGSPRPIDQRSDWRRLPLDFKTHLEWYITNITHYHYGLTYDTEDFFKTVLPSFALESESLLNAVVGFAAYQEILQDPHGKVEDFLKYYNKSVTLLLQSIKQGDKPSVYTLLTILQLATVEEYLGDWVNILGHQKAAFELFTSIFTPETVVESPLGRMALGWYTRFDNFVAIMGGFPTALPREYVESMISYCESRITPASFDNIKWKLAIRTMRIRLVALKMSSLYARGSRGQITKPDFALEHGRITQDLVAWRENWDPDLTDPKYLVNDFGSVQADPDNIVDPYLPGVIFDQPIFSSTITNLEWHCMMITHRTLATDATAAELHMELSKHAFAAFQHYEAVLKWPGSPQGLTTIIQAAIPMASLYLPQDQRHHMWIRRKFALAEQQGYLCPLSVRERLAGFFRDPTCVDWWLPNGEGLTPVLRSIREFADERNAVAMNAQQASVREVRNLFENLSFAGEDTSSR